MLSYQLQAASSKLLAIRYLDIGNLMFEILHSMKIED